MVASVFRSRLQQPLRPKENIGRPGYRNRRLIPIYNIGIADTQNMRRIEDVTEIVRERDRAEVALTCPAFPARISRNELWLLLAIQSHREALFGRNCRAFSHRENPVYIASSHRQDQWIRVSYAGWRFPRSTAHIHCRSR